MTAITARERLCLLLCAAGRSDDEIACEMGRSAKTVRLYLSSATEKLGAKSRAHAIVSALAAGIISLDDCK